MISKMPQQQLQFSYPQWALGLFVLWLILATLAEFETTGDLSVAIAVAIAAGATGQWGLTALAELRGLLGR